ncbi:MAG: hypothetical protein WDN47_01735 [Candidatus Doudnabacteria bacterium]
MSTLGEVLDLGGIIKQSLDLFDGNQAFREEFEKRYTQIGAAIAQEQKIPPMLAINLDEEIVLGADSQRLFDDLKAWLKSNGLSRDPQ